jgi:hypothetical protein
LVFTGAEPPPINTWLSAGLLLHARNYTVRQQV